MAHPMGEAKPGPLRVDFDRRLKLEFHGSDISSDGGLFPYRELDHALEPTGPGGVALSETRRGGAAHPGGPERHQPADKGRNPTGHAG